MRSAVVVALCALALLAMPVLAATTTPPDALDILWADFCDRHPEHVKCVTASPTPTTSASPTSTPTSTPVASPSPTPTPTPVVTATATPSASPTPTRTASPTPTTTPTPSTPPPQLSGFIGPDVSSLPTSGAAWSALKAAADASGGTPNLCDQNNRTHPGTTFAAALVYARTGQTAYRDKVVSLIKAAVPTLVVNCPNNPGNSVLSLGRQLSAYVLAADYVGYRDQSFVTWLRDIRTKTIGQHGSWSDMRNTAKVSSNNWGTFALASLIAADAYLSDQTALDLDWAIFKGYGDASWKFVHTSGYNSDIDKDGIAEGIEWSCPLGYAINPASCADPKREGANVEDAARTAFPLLGNYPAESAQGHALQALLLQKAGYPAWATNDRQVCRNALWRGRGGNINYSSADYWVTWTTNARCDLAQTTKPAGFGRGFGYTDWLFQ